MKRYAPALVLLLAVSAGSGCAVYQSPPAYGHEAPPIAVADAPEFLYVIPSFGVYFVPNISTDVFFVNGRWYFHSGSVWYWGGSYRGPWTHIEVRYIPRSLRRLPRDYRSRYRSQYYRVPYRHWERRRQELPPRTGAETPPYVRKFTNNLYINPRDPDVVFHDGYWYRRYQGIWYQGRTSSGPWRYREMENIPGPVRKLPPDYRQRKGGKPYEEVPWPRVQKKYRKKMERRDREWRDD